jgi:hypothetical protein
MSIVESPHYEVSATVLADWIERRGADKRWTVDGDPYISSRVIIPCRADKLATVLRRANRILLVMTQDRQARGQLIGIDKLDELAEPLSERAFPIPPNHPRPTWADDRCLWLCWKDQKDQDDEWMLAEDSRATAAFKNIISTSESSEENASN